MSSLQQPAIILQHRSAPVRLEPPVTEDSVRKAIEASNADRAAVNASTGLGLPMFPDPAERFERLTQMDIMAAFGRLMDQGYEYEHLHRWLRWAADLKGVAS